MTEIEQAVKAERERCAKEAFDCAVFFLITGIGEAYASCMTVYAKILGLRFEQLKEVGEKAIIEAESRAHELSKQAMH